MPFSFSIVYNLVLFCSQSKIKKGSVGTRYEGIIIRIFYEGRMVIIANCRKVTLKFDVYNWDLVHAVSFF